MITDPETLTIAKTEAIAALRAEAARRGGYEHEAFAAMLREDDERVARGEPSHIPELAREYVENFRSRRTPQERGAARIAAQDAQLALEQAAGRWRAWIQDPAHVDALIALVEAGPSSASVAPEPPQSKIPPWLRRG